jgi:hypothetical protein
MASFLSRMANEASAALSDAYGHLMHGDDAGASAKVVWVVHPTDVPIDIHSSGIIADTTGNSASVAAAAAAMSIAAAAAGGEHSMGGGASSSAAHNKILQHPPSTKSRDEVSGGTSVTSPGRNSSPYLFTQKFGEWMISISLLVCMPCIAIDPTCFLIFVGCIHFQNDSFQSLSLCVKNMY